MDLMKYVMNVEVDVEDDEWNKEGKHKCSSIYDATYYYSICTVGILGKAR